MELDEDYPDMNASPLVRFERFDREDDLIIEFDNMFSNASKIPFFFYLFCQGGFMRLLPLMLCIHQMHLVYLINCIFLQPTFLLRLVTSLLLIL